MTVTVLSAPALTLHLPFFTAHVRSECRGVLGRLSTLYPAGRRLPERGGSTSSFDVVRSSRANGDWDVMQDGQLLGSFRHSTEGIARLEYQISRSAALAVGDRVLVHAAVASWGRDAIVFPGASGLGKSTLVAALSLSGFRYASDELAIVDTQSGLVTPFPKPICLKDGGWRALEAWIGPVSSSVEMVRPDGQTVRYLTAPSVCTLSDDLPVRHVVVPERRPGALASLQPLARSAALARLAEHALNLPRHGRDGVDVLARLVAGAECHALVYADVADAVRIIQSMVAGPLANAVPFTNCDRSPKEPMR
jgi:hypothetical protein